MTSEDGWNWLMAIIEKNEQTVEKTELRLKKDWRKGVMRNKKMCNEERKYIIMFRQQWRGELKYNFLTQGSLFYVDVKF